MRLLGLVALPVIALDQWSKFYVSSNFELYHSVPIIPHWLDLAYARNPGAVFSLLADMPPWLLRSILMSLSVAAIVVLLILMLRARRFGTTSVALALILGGAVGNLIDRGLYGSVVDFIRFHYYDWSYPIFNVADSAITIGVILILLSTFRQPNASD